jgi:Domain of unknown function (DUF4337)
MAEVELPNPHELGEIKEKAFTRRVAMITAVFAVVLAIASLGGTYNMKEMLMAQQQASNQWSYYQAKVIREHLYRSQSMLLETMLLDRGTTMKAEAKERVEGMIKTMGAEEKRYNEEKKEIEKEAKKLENQRDLHRAKDPFFEFGEVLLQIAIVMSTIAILTHSARVFSFALGSAILGALFALNGFFMIVQVPLFH